MGEVVNLRRVRKAAARGTAEASAAANRAAFGRSKVERKQAATEAERLAREIDGARRET